MSNQIKASPVQFRLPFDSLSTGKEQGKPNKCIICAQLFPKQFYFDKRDGRFYIRCNQRKTCSKECYKKLKDKLSPSRIKPIRIYHNRSWLYQKYIIEKVSINQISKICNVTQSTIIYFLKKYKIKIRSRFDSITISYDRDPSLAKKTYQNKDWLHQKYHIEKLSTLKIAKLCKVKGGTVSRSLKKFKINARTYSKALENGRWKNKRRDLYRDKGFLTEKYLDEKLTSREIGELCEIEHCTVLKYLKKLKMPIRDRAEAQIGKIISDKTKKLLSKSLKSFYKNNPSEKEKQIKRLINERMKQQGFRPTKPERIFNEMTPDYISYVGDGNFWVSFKDGVHKNPDFKIIGQKKVIEIWGDYWHKDDDPYDLIYQYAEIGYKCLVIWEYEIKNDPEEIKRNVNNFVSIWEKEKILYNFT